MESDDQEHSPNADSTLAGTHMHSGPVDPFVYALLLLAVVSFVGTLGAVLTSKGSKVAVQPQEELIRLERDILQEALVEEVQRAAEPVSDLSLALLEKQDDAPLTTAPVQRVALFACGPLTTDTYYTLEQDIETTVSPCLTAGGAKDGKAIPAANIVLDCQGHSLIAVNDPETGRYMDQLSVVGSSNFTIQNCVFESPYDITTAATTSVNVIQSATGHVLCSSCNSLHVRNNVIQGSAHFRAGSNAHIHHNLFYDGHLGIDDVYDARVEDNAFVAPRGRPARTGASLAVYWSDGALIQRNSFDGGSDTYEIGDGFDNAVVMLDSHDITVADNTARDYWGCAVEFFGENSNVQILRNEIHGAGTCGVGGWWFVSLHDVLIRDNVVERAPTLFDFVRANGLRNGDQAPTFANNNFVRNVFRNRYAIPQRDQGVAGVIAYDKVRDSMRPVDTDMQSDGDRYRIPDPSEFIVHGNTFTDNVFETELPVVVIPPDVASVDINNTWTLCHSEEECAAIRRAGR